MIVRMICQKNRGSEAFTNLSMMVMFEHRHLNQKKRIATDDWMIQTK